MNRRQWLLSTGALLVTPPSPLAFGSKPTLWEYDFRTNLFACHKTATVFNPEQRYLGYLLFTYTYRGKTERKLNFGWELNKDGTIVKQPFLQQADWLRNRVSNFTDTKWHLQVAADKYAEIDLDNGGILIY